MIGRWTMWLYKRSDYLRCADNTQDPQPIIPLPLYISFQFSSQNSSCWVVKSILPVSTYLISKSLQLAQVESPCLISLMGLMLHWLTTTHSCSALELRLWVFLYDLNAKARDHNWYSNFLISCLLSRAKSVRHFWEDALWKWMTAYGWYFWDPPAFFHFTPKYLLWGLKFGNWYCFMWSN